MNSANEMIDSVNNIANIWFTNEYKNKYML
jgi:hypothetical protein